ncbi:MAG: lysine--tRNA ligase [archaeon]
MGEKDHLILERERKLKEIRALGINPYPYKYNQTHHSDELQTKYKKLKSEQKTKDSVSVAGRIMILRRMGKATFADVQDEKGKIQLYFNQDLLGKPKYKFLKKLDAGDFIGVKGTIFKTRMGEVTVQVKNYELLSKSIRPLPEKFHGIKDAELKYRKRYLDLIMNPETKDLFRKRAKIIKLVRAFLDDLGFLEVETPVLQTLYGGTNAKPFKTHINAYNMQMYLRVAPELYLKRLVIGGFEKVYEIATNFRNEGVDQTHNPEFSMIEWYEAYVDYHKMMDRAETIIKKIAKKVNGSYDLPVFDKVVKLNTKWPRIPMKEAIKKYEKINVDKKSITELKDFCRKNKVDIRGENNKGSLIFLIFDKLVSDKLKNPTWIIDYPKEVSPLAKVHRKDSELVERYELYIGGKEIGDGWSELIDPQAQRQRFETEQKAMREGNEEAHPMDEDFIEALEYGFPVCGGIGMGIDRLVMLITNNWSIRDVMFFPIMKPEQK